MEAPEVPLEAAQEHIHEHAHGHGEGSTKSRWILGVALSSAIVAALAAVASLSAGHHANEALLAQIDANNQILKASDKWSYYQAKGVKLAVLTSKIDLLKALKPSASNSPESHGVPPSSEVTSSSAPELPAADSKHEENGNDHAADSKHDGGKLDKSAKKKETDEEKAKRYEEEQKEIDKEAHEFEHKAVELKEDGEAHLKHHVGLAKSVTMFQICIAIAAISVLTNRRLFWFVSLAFAAYGIYEMALGILR